MTSESGTFLSPTIKSNAVGGSSVTMEVMVDWHPFECYTAHSFEKGKHALMETARFEALPDDSTCVYDAVRMYTPIPCFIRSAHLKYVIITQHHYHKAMALAAQLASEEFTRTKGR